MNNTMIGQFISAKRKSLGMTQQELAEKLQITNKAVSKWETGDGMPDIQLLKPLSKILGVTVDDILNGEEKEAVKSKPTLPIFCWNLPASVVIVCILACAFAVNYAIICLNSIFQHAIIAGFNESFEGTFQRILISLGFFAYWIIISAIFMCRTLKIFDYEVKCEKPLTIIAFISGFVMLFAQQIDLSPINYGMFMFSFALLLGTFHGYRLPHKLFFGFTVLFTCVNGIAGIVDCLHDITHDQMYIFIYKFVTALIFYISYELLEKFSSEYEGYEEQRSSN
ncbi:MAG: helix-turn-helix domain-containing protein [Candidatus Fimenecus sp.]